MPDPRIPDPDRAKRKLAAFLKRLEVDFVLHLDMNGNTYNPPPIPSEKIMTNLQIKTRVETETKS